MMRAYLSSLVLVASVVVIAPAAESRAQEKPAPSEKAFEAQNQQRALGNIWWNQERKLAKVPLSKEKRTQMDALLQAHLAERAERIRKNRVNNFADALGKGDWQAALKAAEQRADSARDATLGQMRLKIEVLKLLSDEERASIQETFPMLLRRDWLLGPNRMMQHRGNFRRGADTPSDKPKN